MRKIIFLIHVTLDGFVAGLNGEMDWITYNDEVEKYAHTLHSTTNAAMYGRTTFQMMEGYFPTVPTNPDSTPGDRKHAQWLDEATKIVVSTTLENPRWKNTVVIHDNVADEIMKIKEQPGKDTLLLGSPTLAQTLMQHDLIDEYRINVNPVLLGAGKLLFSALDTPLSLRLLESKTFSGGVVALRYESVRQ